MTFLQEYPETKAAQKLKDSDLLTHAKRLMKENEEAERALDRLKARLRSYFLNNAYREAYAAAVQSSEQRRFGGHPIFVEYMAWLRAKAGLD